MHENATYRIKFFVEYPDRELDRLTTLLRPLLAIPIVLLLASVMGQTFPPLVETRRACWP